MANVFADFNFNIVLPDINGVYEAGITLSSDTALADFLKLAVFVGDLDMPGIEALNADAAALGEIRIRALASAL